MWPPQAPLFHITAWGSVLLVGTLPVVQRLRICFPMQGTRVQSPASLVAQVVKDLPAMQETWALSLGQEEPLEKRMAIYSSIL